MQCHDFMSGLTDYLEGNASPEAALQIRAHVQECSDCRLVIESARSTIESFWRVIH